MALNFSRSTSPVLECQVVLLDNSEFETVFVKSSVLGREIFDIVCNKLDIPQNSKGYFGLRFTDREDGELNWLNLEKEIPVSSKSRFINYQFAFKVFPSEPLKASPVVRDLLRLQIKDLLNRGKLTCPPDKQAILDGYFAQAMLGDYNNKQHVKGYLEDLLGSFYVRPSGINCNVDMCGANYEAMVTSLHKSHRGMSVEKATLAYLDVSQSLPFFGMFLHKKAHEEKGSDVSLAVCDRGIYVFELDEFKEPGNIKKQFFWQDIVTILCDSNKAKFHIVALEKPQMGPLQTYTYKFSSGHYSHKAAERILTDALNHEDVFAATEHRRYQRSKSEQAAPSSQPAVPGQRDRVGSSPFLTPQLTIKKFLPSFKRTGSARN